MLRTAGEGDGKDSKRKRRKRGEKWRWASEGNEWVGEEKGG
jgi:hypothetical protein